MNDQSPADTRSKIIEHALNAGHILGLYKAAHGHAMARDVIQGDEWADLLESLHFLGIDADADDIEHLWILAGAAVQRAAREMRAAGE